MLLPAAQQGGMLRGVSKSMPGLPGVHRTQASSRGIAVARALSDTTSPTDSSTNVAVVGPGIRQMYIQESVNFTGAELAARLHSMQAALRAQRAEAAAASAGGSSLPMPAPAPAAGLRGHPSSYAAAASTATSAASSSRISHGYGSTGPSAYTPPSPAPVPSSRPFVNSPSSARPTFIPNAMASSVNVTERAVAQVGTSEAGADLNTVSLSSSNSSSVSLPFTDNLAGLSASEKLQALQQVQQVSRQAVQQVAANQNSSYYANAPKTIDIRMYEQLVAAHNKQSKKMGEINAHIDVLEEQINTCNDDLMSAFELLKQIAMEFGTTSRLASSTAAAIQFGVDPQDALDKVSKLQERLSTLEQAVLEQRKEFGLRVVRKVPVEWIGVATEVRVMGDFDDWTRGHELSAEDVTTDSVFNRFEGTLLLRPGRYHVKFLVDGEWRLAADWPTEGDDNVLVVS